MKPEPHFLLEPAGTRWGAGWQLSQFDGPVLLPGPLHYRNLMEAIGYAKTLSADFGCVVVVRLSKEGCPPCEPSRLTDSGLAG